MFYSDLYRRHLLDMHIEDWHSDFLKDFSPETYVENLKTAGINYAMIYLQSHAGLCYWPTRSGVMHRRFETAPNLIKRVVELCRESDIRVCGYYSLIYNTREHDRHPEWQMKQQNGFSRREDKSALDQQSLTFTDAKAGRYGLCCPNNPDYRSFVYTQVDEMLDFFELDALFFDMPFWPHTCHCDHCKAAYGKPFPAEKDPALLEFKAQKMGEFVQSITDYIKARRPDLPIEYNCAQLIAGYSRCGCAEGVLNACDYAGGDLYGDLYNHSFACKFYKNATRNQPFEQMFSRCKPALSNHTLTKTLDEMKTAVASTMAHHGATLVIDAIDPIGTMDGRVYQQFGQVFDFQKPYEPHFKGEMIEEIGLYYGIQSRRTTRTANAVIACANTTKTLAQAHIPFGVTGNFHSLNYKIIAAPVLSALEEGDNERLIRYVAEGGTLYLSGCGNAKLVEALTGNRLISETEHEKLYLAPAEGREALFGDFNAAYPLPLDGKTPLVQPQDAEILATLTLPYTKPSELRFASIHSNPPGIATDYPAVTANRYGKGMVIWSAAPLEMMPYTEYRQIFLNLLHLNAAPDYFFTTDAPRNVELTAFRTENGITLNAVVMDEGSISAPAAPFTVCIKGEATAVRLLPAGESVPFTVQNGYTRFTTRTLHIFDMYEIK